MTGARIGYRGHGPRPRGVTASGWLLLAGTLLAGLAGPVGAEIYKYQDASGDWHYTDRPPRGQTGTEVVTSPGARAPAGRDLRQTLYEHYQPRTPLEEATLAVVSIRTPLVTGSGFFISDDGYLLTNKHVVRPGQFAELQERADKLEKNQAALREAEQRLSQRRAQLEALRRSLDKYEKAIDKGQVGELGMMEYQAARERYESRSSELETQQRAVDDFKRRFERERSEFSLKRSAATVASSFRVTLKDGTEVHARLVAVAEDQDLALLRLDGYHTPHITPEDQSAPVQGTPVYAIGSPWGMADAVTAGVVTRVRGDYIVSDAQVMPGNSGGPLIDEEGRVLGVNTMKVARYASANGFGVAIRYTTVRREFRGELGH